MKHNFIDRRHGRQALRQLEQRKEYKLSCLRAALAGEENETAQLRTRIETRDEPEAAPAGNEAKRNARSESAFPEKAHADSAGL